LKFIIILVNKHNTNMKKPTIPLLLVLTAILLNASTAKAGFYLPEDAYRMDEFDSALQEAPHVPPFSIFAHPISE